MINYVEQTHKILGFVNEGECIQMQSCKSEGEFKRGGNGYVRTFNMNHYTFLKQDSKYFMKQFGITKEQYKEYDNVFTTRFGLLTRTWSKV